MESGLLVFMAGAAGAALIKLVDNLIQFLLARKAKKADKKEEKEASIEDVLKELAELKKLIEAQKDVTGEQANAIERHSNSLRILMFDKIDYLANKFIGQGSVPRGIRKDIDAFYRSYKVDLEANGDLAYTMELFYALPMRPD